jgi:heme/copper-type cytochrome/quinol oxidase subunit 4
MKKKITDDELEEMISKIHYDKDHEKTELENIRWIYTQRFNYQFLAAFLSIIATFISFIALVKDYPAYIVVPCILVASVISIIIAIYFFTEIEASNKMLRFFARYGVLAELRKFEAQKRILNKIKQEHILTSEQEKRINKDIEQIQQTYDFMNSELEKYPSKIKDVQNQRCDEVQK